MTAADDLNAYLDAVLGDTEGYLHTATGIGPYFNERGVYAHKKWEQRCHSWPADRRAAVAELLGAAEQAADAYLCPYLMVGLKRGKGAAAARDNVHADIDGQFDLDAARRLGACAVASGTPDHAHVYVALTESVPAHWHEPLCRGLGDYLGAADAKISDNDVLRPPGTWNQKARVRAPGGEPTPVQWLLRPENRMVWEPRALAEKLGVNLPEKADANPAPGLDNAPAEPLDLDTLPAAVAEAIKPNTGDRSGDTMRIVAACYDAGLSLGQTRTAVDSRADLADRLAARPDDDVATCWQKITRNRQAEEVDADTITATKTAGDVHRGQARIAYRLADRYRDKLLHVYGIGWHSWDGTRFVLDDRGAATRAVLAELRRALRDSLADKELRADVRKCESASGVAGVLALAGALEPLSAAVADIDADPYLLNVANGTLDLHTLELHPHRAADRITKVCRGAYTPGAQSPVWEEFLARVLPDEDVRRFVQRLVGVGLLGAVREHVLPIWTGKGANGKSVMDAALRYTLGDYAGTAEPDLIMHREGAHPTGEMDLRGVRWIVVTESDKDRRLAEATMKRLTGGDTIRARRMRQDFVEFTPSHTPLLITNHLPRVSGDDPAIWRRLRVVPFDVVIPEAEQDRELGARLELEADAILSWAVEGWRDYCERGLAEPPGVRQATDTYHQDNDAVRRFIEDRCLTDSPLHCATAGQLFRGWEDWRAADGAEPLSLKAFGLALSAKGYPPEPAVNGKRWRRGIMLAPAVEGGEADE